MSIYSIFIFLITLPTCLVHQSPQLTQSAKVLFYKNSIMRNIKICFLFFPCESLSCKFFLDEQLLTILACLSILCQESCSNFFEKIKIRTIIKDSSSFVFLIIFCVNLTFPSLFLYHFWYLDKEGSRHLLKQQATQTLLFSSHINCAC